MYKRIRLSSYSVYLTTVSVVGFLLLLWGIWQVPSYEPRLSFLLLLLLAAVSAVATTSMAVSDKAGITYAIDSAVSISAIPFFGPGAAVVIVFTFNLCVWLIKPTHSTTWKKSWSQLAFNIGMLTISIFTAGQSFLFLRFWLGSTTIWGQILPWLIAATIYEAVNYCLLIIVLRLQHGPNINPLTILKEEQWAMQIGILTMFLGGATLAFAIQHYDWIGIGIFFLPILLSSYAFHLYVQQMLAHLNNLEQIIEDRTKDLAELNRQKDAFLAVLTHDMMTPLTSIQMYIEAIQDEPEIIIENPQLAKHMMRSQKTLSEMVRNILDIEKLQSGQTLATHKVACDVAQSIKNTTDIIQAEAEGKRISIRHDLPTQPLWVRADRQQLDRILLNLISNAIKYTPTGGTVCAEARHHSQHAIIRVKDTGYGIPEEELPHVFERFRRVTHLKDKAIGTGLGLAITKALVEGHDGTISVTSEEGKGSVFTVELPVESVI